MKKSQIFEFFNPQKRCRYKRSTRYAQDEKKYSKSTSKSGHGSKRPNSFNKQYPNHGKPWSKVQNDKLKKLVAEKKGNDFIAKAMGRSARSIELQRDRLGLWQLPPSHISTLMEGQMWMILLTPF